MKNICIGIDISKETIDVTVISVKSLDLLASLGYQQFKNQPVGFRSMISWTKKLIKHEGSLDDCLFCMETTGGYDRHICSYLYDKGMHVWRQSALEIRRKSGFRHGKSDKADSANIAEYAAKNQDKLIEYAPDSQIIADLKELINYRDGLVERRKECKTRLSTKKTTTVDKTNNTWRFIQRKTNLEIRRLDKEIDECETMIEEAINSDETIKKHYLHVKSITGIGLVNSSALIAYSGDFQKIPTANKMACYCGCVTFYEDSGTSVHKKSQDKNVCCKKLKQNLRMAAKSAMLANPDLRAYAERLKRQNKPHGIILNNIANKLLHIIYSLVKHDCDYERNHEFMKQLREKEPKAA